MARITAVAARYESATVEAPAAAAATSVTVDTTVLLDLDTDTGETCQAVIAGSTQPFTVIGTDDDEDTGICTLTLAAPGLPAAVEVGDEIRLWDPLAGESGRETVTYKAPVSDEDGAYEAEFSSAPTVTPESLVGAEVDVDDDGFVERVYGRQAVVDGGTVAPGTLNGLDVFIPGTEPSGAGQTFSEDPAPATAEGYPEGHVWWQVLDGAVEAAWRVDAGVWVSLDVVKGDAAYFQNAIITALNTTDLSTVNLSAVNIDGVNMRGGAIAISAGAAGSLSEDFAGTSFPAGWINAKTLSNNAGVKASVVATGPTGQDGSAILIDYGPAGVTSPDGGHVASTLTPATMQSAKVRFRVNAYRDPDSNRARMEQAALVLRGPSTGLYTGQAVFVDLIPVGPSPFTGVIRFDIWAGFGWSGGPTWLGTYSIPTNRSVDPTVGWCWAALRVEGDVASVKIWADDEAEPQWKTYSAHSLPSTPGTAALEWEHGPSWSPDGLSRGVQKVWVDHFEAESRVSGFIVNPDGTGEWPAIGLGQADPAWRVVGAGNQPAFQNGWTAMSGEQVTFKKDSTGNVHIRGRAVPPATPGNTSIFTLPVGYRPDADLFLVGRTSNSNWHGNYTIFTNGEVRYIGASDGGSPGWVSATFTFPGV